MWRCWERFAVLTPRAHGAMGPGAVLGELGEVNDSLARTQAESSLAAGGEHIGVTGRVP